MLQTAIALLIALGIITSQTEFNSLSEQERSEMVNIVTDDIMQQ
ncbi:MAG: hypothetical protein AAFZ15_33190 [Bacteroidota bacterium]